jgi:hypothetical protein
VPLHPATQGKQRTSLISELYYYYLSSSISRTHYAGAWAIVLQRPQTVSNPQADEQPMTTYREISMPTPIAVNNDETVFISAAVLAISKLNDWITDMTKGDKVTARLLMPDSPMPLFSPDFLISFSR